MPSTISYTSSTVGEHLGPVKQKKNHFKQVLKENITNNRKKHLSRAPYMMHSKDTTSLIEYTYAKNAYSKSNHDET